MVPEMVLQMVQQRIFEVWDQSTGHVHTALESPSFTLTGLGLNYIDLDIDYSQYTIYRNGEAIVSGLTSESYQDNELEGEMDYEYAVAVENILGSWSYQMHHKQSLLIPMPTFKALR